MFYLDLRPVYPTILISYTLSVNVIMKPGEKRPIVILTSGVEENRLQLVVGKERY
jgi:hypothetical protein